MMRLVIILVVALLLGLGLSLGLQYDLGYIRISLGNYLVETNFWVGVVLLVVLTLALMLLISAVRRLTRGTGAVTHWLARSQKRRARRRTTEGLLALAEGNWPHARKKLESSAEQADTPLINYLAAAQAASEAGDHDAVDELLRKAFESTPGSDLAVGITQAQLQLNANRLEQALATLVRLRKQAPHHPFVLKLLKNTYLRLEDWRAAEECRRQGNQDLSTLTRLWDELPSSMRRDEHTIRVYTELLAKAGQEAQAETLLRKVLRNHWSDELIHLYGRICGSKPDEQLLAAERWLQDRPNNPELLLALGRLSLRNELWGKARDYFETSLHLRRSQETLAELSRLNAHMGDEDASMRLMQGLVKETGLPELPMPKA